MSEKLYVLAEGMKVYRREIWKGSGLVVTFCFRGQLKTPGIQGTGQCSEESQVGFIRRTIEDTLGV